MMDRFTRRFYSFLWAFGLALFTFVLLVVLFTWATGMSEFVGNVLSAIMLSVVWFFALFPVCEVVIEALENRKNKKNRKD